MSRFLFIPAIALTFVLFAAACSDDDAKPSGPVSSDEEYLSTFCTGLSGLSSALVSKPTADEIAQVIKTYSADLKKLNPPKDLEQFHKDYVKFLDDSVDDPTSVLTRKPPVPKDDVRKKYADLENTLPDCKNARYFVQS